MVYINKLLIDKGIAQGEVCVFKPLFSGNKDKVSVSSNVNVFESMSKRAVSVPVSQDDYYWDIENLKDDIEPFIRHRRMFFKAGHGLMVDVIRCGKTKGHTVYSKTGDADENAYLRI